MAACEACWDDAYMRARMLGGSQVDHYRALLIERAAGHPRDTPTDDAQGGRADG